MESTAQSILIRPIHREDNPAIADIIRSTLAEFGANQPGTAYYDKATDDMYAAFQQKGSRYFVARAGGKVVGGGGIFPSPGLPENVCELVKMYLHTSARGLGIGGKLIRQSLDFARTYGYKQTYLETMPELQKAVAIYEKMGFRRLTGPMGNTGHYSCSIWMLIDL